MKRTKGSIIYELQLLGYLYDLDAFTQNQDTLQSNHKQNEKKNNGKLIKSKLISLIDLTLSHLAE
jgi:hypothetical protein